MSYKTQYSGITLPIIDNYINEESFSTIESYIASLGIASSTTSITVNQDGTWAQLSTSGLNGIHNVMLKVSDNTILTNYVCLSSGSSSQVHRLGHIGAVYLELKWTAGETMFVRFNPPLGIIDKTINVVMITN